MKRTLYLFLMALLVIGLTLTACNTATPDEIDEAVEPEPAEVDETEAEPETEVETEAEAEVEEPEAEPIVAAASLPLTGSFSIPGEKHGDGYQLCIDQINERGGLLGRPVELLISDNQSDAETAISQFERFINQDDVDLIFGTFSSLLTFPASTVTEQAQIVHPIPSAAALRIYERGYEYLFYFQPNAAEYIGETPIVMMEDLLSEEEMPETVALVWADDFFANAIANGLLGGEVAIEGTDRVVDLSPGALAEAGMEVVYEEQWPEQGFSDWITLANAVKASEADFLMALVTSPSEGIQLVRALQTVDYQPEGFFMSQGAQSEFQQELGSAVNGTMIHGSWHPQANFSGVLVGEEFTNEQFMQTFEEQYGRAADEDEAIPFAVCQGMAQAVEGAGTTDNTALRDWLAARTEDDPVRTILGDFHWDERGLPVAKPFIMVQWQDENLEFVYPTDAFPGVEELVWPKPEW